MSIYLLGSRNPAITLPISADAAKLSEKLMEAVTQHGFRPNDGQRMLQPMSAEMLILVVGYCESHIPGKAVDPVADRARLTLETRQKRMNLVTAASHLRIEKLQELSIQIFCDHEETDENQTCVKLQSIDGKVFNLSIEAAKQSKVLLEILKRLQGKIPVNPIPFHFKNEELEVAQKWMEHHKGEPIPEINRDPYRVTVPDFDKQLLRVDSMTLVRTTSLAFHLEINGLERSSSKTWIDRAPYVSNQEKDHIFLSL